MKFLIADDEKTNYLLLHYMLQSYNIETVYARNGIEAIDKFKMDKFDLILMDIQMPIMDGMESSKIIKSINSDIPIIFVTAYGDQIKDELIGLNYQGILMKPVNSKMLINELKKFVNI